MQAATLGDIGVMNPEECRIFNAEVTLQHRAHRAWN